MQRQIQIQPLSRDRYQHISADGNPYLALDRVLRSTEETFDPQMLFYPFEKELDRPPALVQGADAQRWNAEMIGQEDERFVGRRIPISDSAQLPG